MKKDIELLKNHPYEINFREKDGRWITRVRTPDGKIKQIRKTKKEDIIDAVVAYYQDDSDKQRNG